MAINVVSDGDILEEADWTSVITTVENTGNGHDHDGTDSKNITASTISGGITYVVKQDSGTASGADPVVVSTYSFSANELAVGDLLTVRATVDQAAAGSGGEWKLTATDTGTAGDLTSTITTSSGNKGSLEFTLHQSLVANDTIASSWVGSQVSGTAIAASTVLDTNDANVFATAWTLNFSLDANSTDSRWYWAVSVHKAP